MPKRFRNVLYEKEKTIAVLEQAITAINDILAQKDGATPAIWQAGTEAVFAIRWLLDSISETETTYV